MGGPRVDLAERFALEGAYSSLEGAAVLSTVVCRSFLPMDKEIHGSNRFSNLHMKSVKN